MLWRCVMWWEVTLTRSLSADWCVAALARYTVSRYAPATARVNGFVSIKRVNNYFLWYNRAITVIHLQFERYAIFARNPLINRPQIC